MPSTLKSFSAFAGEVYVARLLSEEDWTPGLTYPSLIEDAWVEGTGVEVILADGTSWIARFAGTAISPKALTVGLYHPCPHKMCVVARGVGYEVNVKEPADWIELPLLPIMGGLVVEEQRALVFWDYTRLIAVFEDGVRWCSPSLSWDGISNVQYKDGMITADVWDGPSDSTIRAMIQLKDGRVVRGSDSLQFRR